VPSFSLVDYSSTLKREGSCSTETIVTTNKFYSIVCKVTQNFIFTAVTESNCTSNCTRCFNEYEIQYLNSTFNHTLCLYGYEIQY
jgi:hypothetical protein